MSKKILLSAVVSVFNGEKELDDCLKSLSWTSEIIVVDNSSTDKTLEIARKYTDKIFTRPNNPMLNVNKNFGFSRAIGEWILYLDADERVTLELKEEIKKVITKSWGDPSTRPAKRDFAQDDSGAVNGYWIPRKNIIFGKWIQHTGWYPDHQLRLFKKGKGKFPQEHVHEMVKVEGKIEYLKSHILHYNYDNISQFLKKLGTIYGPNEAEQLIKNGYNFDWRDSIRFPVKEFLSRFFAREGYKDGLHGLMLSLLMAFYHFVVFTNIWERQGFKQLDREKILEETSREFKKSYKELLFWSSSEKIKSIKNPIKRPLYKLLNRLTKS